MLPGEGRTIEGHQIKQLYLRSYPVAWQDDWMSANQRLGESSISDVTRYMEQRKGRYDLREQENKAKRKSNKQKGKDKQPYKAQGGKPKHKKNLCNHHNKVHEWKECPLNKNSPNFDPKAKMPYKKWNNNNNNRRYGDNQNKPQQGGSEGYYQQFPAQISSGSSSIASQASKPAECQVYDNYYDPVFTNRN